MAQVYRKDDEPVPGYKLVKELGSGGFGVVWKAKGPGGAEVALKIISLGGDSQGMKEFRAIQLVKNIKHSYLVPIYAIWLKDEFANVLDDTVTDDSLTLKGKASELLIAMGLGDMNLLDRLKECKKEGHQGIPADELLGYMKTAARAIDFLNRGTPEKGVEPIQHRDIKPHNILLVAGVACVCDFGLARAMGTDSHSTRNVGTPAYMAPEAMMGKPSKWTDQYSLAVTYAHLRTGKHPIASSNVAQVMYAHLQGALDLSGLPEAELAVIKRAVSVDPSKRFESVEEMFKHLRRAVENPGAMSLPRPPESSSPPARPADVSNVPTSGPASSKTGAPGKQVSRPGTPPLVTPRVTPAPVSEPEAPPDEGQYFGTMRTSGDSTSRVPAKSGAPTRAPQSGKTTTAGPPSGTMGPRGGQASGAGRATVQAKPEPSGAVPRATVHKTPKPTQSDIGLQAAGSQIYPSPIVRKPRPKWIALLMVLTITLLVVTAGVVIGVIVWQGQHANSAAIREEVQQKIKDKQFTAAHDRVSKSDLADDDRNALLEEIRNAWRRYARDEFDAGHKTNGCQECKKLLQLYPNDPDATSYLQRWCLEEGSPSFDLLISRAEQLYKESEWVKSEDALRLAAKEATTAEQHVRLKTLRALLWSKNRGDYSRAVDTIRELLQEKSPPRLNELCQALVSMAKDESKHQDAASKILREALKTVSGQDREVVQKALDRLEPPKVSLDTLLAEAEKQLRDRDFKEAAATIDKIENFPGVEAEKLIKLLNPFYAYWWMRDPALKEKRAEGVRKLLKDVLAEPPSSLPVVEAYADLVIEEPKYAGGSPPIFTDAAIRRLTGAERGHAHFINARSYQEAKNLVLGIDQMREALKFAPKAAKGYLWRYELAEMLEKLARKPETPIADKKNYCKEALKFLNEAEQTAPGDWKARIRERRESIEKLAKD